MEGVRGFVSVDVDYVEEVSAFEQSGIFSGPMGDLMPLAIANLFRFPLAIITSEPNNPIISVCPSRNMVSATPIFLAYNSYGGGHYSAASKMQRTLSSGRFVVKMFILIGDKLCMVYKNGSP